MSGLNKPLPSNINILTLEPWGDNTILLRLEHILEVTDDLKFSVPVTVNLNVSNLKNVKYTHKCIVNIPGLLRNVYIASNHIECLKNNI